MRPPMMPTARMESPEITLIVKSEMSLALLGSLKFLYQ